MTACLVCSVDRPGHGHVLGDGRHGRRRLHRHRHGAGHSRSGWRPGPIVCGAYFGDKMSPFSDIPNLAAVTAGANLFDHIKHMMWSAAPGWLLSLVVFFFVGLRYAGRTIDSPTMTLILDTLKKNFRFNVWLLLPMLIVFYLAFTKRPTIPGMLLSARHRRRPGHRLPARSAWSASPRP